MKKIVIYVGAFLIFTVFPVVFVFTICNRAMDEQYVFLSEKMRVEIIGIADDFHRLSTVEFKDNLVCIVYDLDESFKRIIEGRNEAFLRSANVVPRGIRSRADHVYENFDLSEDEIVVMCGDKSG